MLQNSFTEILNLRSGKTERGITFIEANGQEDFLSYKQVYTQALKSLGYLQHKGLQPRDELVFQIDDNKTFIIIFWACVLGGIVPVPLAIGQNADHKQKLFKIWPSLNNPYLIISQDNLKRLKEFAGQYELKDTYAEINEKMIDLGDIFSVDSGGQIFDAQSNDLLFIQFSSGSTGSPKGVTLTHRNVALNIEAIGKASGYSDRDTMISWMPLTHDMGLIGFHLSPLFHGINHYLLPTSVFIRRPSLWLEKAGEHKISILCSPNFGYKYTLKHCLNSKKYNWDLSDVRLLYNGAEPISKELCDQFLEALSGYGLRSQAMCPVYGLAEASLAVSISNPEDEVISVNLDRNKLNIGDKVVEYSGSNKSVSFVNVGKSIENCAIRITDDKDVNLEDCMIGHVQIKGDNVSSGYYNNEQETQKVLTKDGWLKTGDLGFIKDGALYITGRLKDIIFVNGQNYYPHDIEKVAEQVDGIDLNKIAVSGFHNDKTQKDEIVAFVFYRGNIEGFIPAALGLKSHINIQMGITLDSIVPVKSIPKTTSGKLQRFKLLERLKRGDFKEVENKMAILIAENERLTRRLYEPENDVEKRLLLIWKEVLGYSEIGVTNKFFEIGGDSLKAAMVEMLVLKEFNAELPLESLFQKQTIRELASEIITLDKQTYKPISIVQKQDYYPLGLSQKRLYYAWELDKSSVAYNIPVTFRLVGEINVGKLQHCFEKLIKRHDSLRMSFQLVSELEFKIHSKVGFKLHHFKCQESEIKKKLKSFVQPFDLSKPPLFRSILVNIKKAEFFLFLDFHHIISDGLSIYNFVKELFDIYKGDDLAELPVQYKDFVHWEKENLSLAKMKSQEKYWLDHLSGEIPMLEMPLDFPRPAIFDSKGEKIEFQIDKNTSMQLKRLANAHGCTLHVLMFTLYNLLLSKYTRQESIVVGIPIAGRRHPDLQEMFGMFVNNLVIKSTFNEDESFIKLLKRQKNNLICALNNQDYPFEELKKKIGGNRNVSRNPVFDTMFLYQNMSIPYIVDESFTYSRYFFDPGFSKFDISMEVTEDVDRINYYIEYASSLFKRETILDMGIHFRNLINETVNRPHNKISCLSLLSENEHYEYVNKFNATKSSYPKHQTIQQLFSEQVARKPEAVALEFNGMTITYKQLNKQVNQLANTLRQNRIFPNKAVGLLLKRSPQLIVGILGILKSGGCYVPIDVDLPIERIKYLIGNSQCSMVVTDSDYISKFENYIDPSLTFVDINKQFNSPKESDHVQNENNSSDLAYIMYTSGTTGEPKGVMIKHQSLVNYVVWASRYYIGDEQVSFPLFTSVSFDLTVTTIFVPLVTGNRLIIYDENEKDLSITRVLSDNQVDVIKLTPSHLKVIIQIKPIVPIAENRIKKIIVGGEVFERQLAQDIYDKFEGNIELYNEYGPTETTVGCMIYKFNPQDTSNTVPIGIPINNTQVYLLDRYLKPVSTSVYGEIYISGDGIAKGYLLKKELTKRKFITNPFIKGEKMYKTGDIAKRLPNGYIEYIGRQDKQIKINGYRIELSEIEDHLNSHYNILQAIVTLKKDKKSKKNLYAYYLTKSKQENDIEESELRNFLAVRLPHYMIPVRFIYIENIPLTKNGKVHYEALPDPKPKNITNKRQKSKNEVEKVSLKIWEEVLEEKNILVTNNFFELGGDSIKAFQIASRLAEKGINISVKDILTYHTIEQISLHIEFGNKKYTYEQGVVEGEKDLTPIESWLFEQGLYNPNYYNQSVLLKVNKKIDIRLLEEAFEKIIEHHDGLRINYNPKKRLLFYNNWHLEQKFEIKVYKTKSKNNAASDLIKICQGIKATLDITKGLLLKAAIIKESGSTEKLFITVHHLVTDVISWRILLEDLNLIYNSLKINKIVKLPGKTASLIDWRREFIKYAESTEFDRQEGYWNEVDSEKFTLPQDFETSDWRVKHLRKISGSLDKENTKFLLKEAHQTYKTDVLILFNTALVLTLKEWTCADSFIIEHENHGRQLESIDVSRTLGWFTSLYPIRLELKNDLIQNQIKSIKEQIRNVPNHGIGYGICRYMRKTNKSQKDKLSELRFNYIGQFSNELDNELFTYVNKSTGYDVDPGNLATTKMELNAMIVGGKLYLEISYNQKAHKKTTMRWFKDTFFDYLYKILNHIRNEKDLHFTPSDFDTVDLDQEELDELFR